MKATWSPTAGIHSSHPLSLHGHSPLATVGQHRRTASGQHRHAATPLPLPRSVVSVTHYWRQADSTGEPHQASTGVQKQPSLSPLKTAFSWSPTSGLIARTATPPTSPSQRRPSGHPLQAG